LSISGRWAANNCRNTLPYVTGWHEKYKDQGLVVIGVHTPEFSYERDTVNVKNCGCAAPDRLPGGAGQRIRHMERPVATATGPPPTSWMPGAASGTSRSARAATKRRNRSSNNSWLRRGRWVVDRTHSAKRWAWGLEESTFLWLWLGFGLPLLAAVIPVGGQPTLDHPPVCPTSAADEPGRRRAVGRGRHL